MSLRNSDPIAFETLPVHSAQNSYSFRLYVLSLLMIIAKIELIYLSSKTLRQFGLSHIVCFVLYTSLSFENMFSHVLYWSPI